MLVAMASPKSAVASFPADLRQAPIINGPGPDTYPIASYTWILLYQSPTDKDKGRKMVALMRWAITDGEAFAKDLGYAPLPDAVVKLEQDTLGKIQVQ